MKDSIWFRSAIVLGLAIALSGFFIGNAIDHYAQRDRAVCVKGLSTRQVMADHAVWPLSYTISGDDLPTLYQDLSNRERLVRSFLKKQGFSDEDMQSGNVSVSNNWESYYGQRPEHRYTLTANIVISTDSVDLVRRSQGCQSQLLAQGVVLETQDWQLDYQFNGLNELKPVMIEEATKNARAVAQKFADDAECRLGSIKTAYQGQFSVETDSNCPWEKHVRVVTTIEYYLD